MELLICHILLRVTSIETDTSLSVNRSWAQCLLPFGFYFCWLANMVMNMIWLLLWDREYVFRAVTKNWFEVCDTKSKENQSKRRM